MSWDTDWSNGVAETIAEIQSLAAAVTSIAVEKVNTVELFTSKVIEVPPFVNPAAYTLKKSPFNVELEIADKLLDADELGELRAWRHLS